MAQPTNNAADASELVSKILSIEIPLLEARGLMKAMVMALAGKDAAAIGSEEDEDDVLERLARAVERNIDEAAKLWNDALHQARGG